MKHERAKERESEEVRNMCASRIVKDAMVFPHDRDLNDTDELSLEPKEDSGNDGAKGVYTKKRWGDAKRRMKEKDSEVGTSSSSELINLVRCVSAEVWSRVKL